MNLPAHVRVLRRMARRRTDFVLIGVFAINHYAPDPSFAYATQDCDILVRPEPGNLSKALACLVQEGYELFAGSEPLPPPDSLTLRRLTELRAVVRGRKEGSLAVDVVLEAGAISYARWRRGSRVFRVGGASVRVAGLNQLITSKKAAGRKKDRDFLRLYSSVVRDAAMAVVA